MTDTIWTNDPGNSASYGDRETMDEAMETFGAALDQAFDVGYDIGYKHGYQKAVEDSYPELNE